MVLRPGFEPGSPARKAGILDRAILPEPELERWKHGFPTLPNVGLLLKVVFWLIMVFRAFSVILLMFGRCSRAFWIGLCWSGCHDFLK